LNLALERPRLAGGDVGVETLELPGNSSLSLESSGATGWGELAERAVIR
jgi:hypothetical protein